MKATFENRLLFIVLIILIILAIPLVNDNALNSLTSFTGSMVEYSPKQNLPDKATLEFFNELTK